MKLDNIKELDKKYFMNTFGERTPVAFEYGKGMYLWDTEGNKYLDMLAGIAVSALGHSHPKVINALKTQANKLIHCSSLYYIESQAKLAEVLVNNSCADKVFFANSGAEANEGAIKLARIYFKKKGMPERHEIITLDNSFHGRTLATIAATGQTKYQKNYSPLTPKFISVPMNKLKELEEAITEYTCAIMIEPIQGESGVNLMTPEFVKGIREICDTKDILLIFDEVQCGIGRTGKMFGYEHLGVEPDIFTLAKALGAGFPIGALCAKDFVADAFEPGDHGSTFGGNPLACSTAYATFTTILEDNIVNNSANMGIYLKDKLNGLKEKFPCIVEVRGKGLMIGIQFDSEISKEVNKKLFEKGVLAGSVGTSILRLLPPLIISKEDINYFVNILDEVLTEV